MAKETLKFVGLTSALGAVAGGYAQSCQDGECWEAEPYVNPRECPVTSVPASCALDEIAHTVMQLPAPALEYPQGAVIGTTCGLVAGAVLSLLADRLDKRSGIGRNRI